MRVLLFIIVFIYIEVSLAGLVVDKVGLLNTILLMFLSALLGIILLRRQSLKTIEAAKSNLANGQAVNENIISGFGLMISGFLFIFPGFFSDILAVLLLIPFVRLALIKSLKPTVMRPGMFFKRSVIFSSQKSWNQADEMFNDNTNQQQKQGEKIFASKTQKMSTGSNKDVIIDCTASEMPKDSRQNAQYETELKTEPKTEIIIDCEENLKK